MAIKVSKAYNPKDVEVPIYRRWEKSGYFNPDKLPNASKRKPFSISMPPPNVTGELHLGHVLDLTTQDILIRFRRMHGDASLWVPGTDHAGIATQIMVERMLRESGISRCQIGREKFLHHVWQWKKKYGTRIVEQIKKLGASCDWSREHFTMDPALTKAVRTAFLQLYADGLIYRGERVIHWCVADQTGISDLEVEYREQAGSLWYIRYPLTDKSGSITVATTRPETMLGDSAVAVYPDDKRYQPLIGKSVRLPIVGRVIAIVADRQVDPTFGTGAVKVTPAHDAADFEIAQRHRLEAFSVIGLDGKMTTTAGRDFQGLNVREARELIVSTLKEQGLLEREEPYTHNVAYCSRSHTIIEPVLSKQWFVNTKPLAKKALSFLRAGKIEIVPKHFEKVLIHWLQNIKDWNISRQLWWGHRIPIWYCVACNEPVASIGEPKKRCAQCGNNAFRQDEDTLDTWFSSGLWTFSTLGWPEKTRDLTRFHPTSVLGTGWDILFFWVARMIMLSLYLLKHIPFRTVYIHGLILDKDGKKMSKSKGTGIDPIPMTEKYGTDAIRLSLIVGTAPGQDFRMSEQKIAGQRNFCNKLWNVSRYILSQSLPKSYKLTPKTSTIADRWIIAKLQDVTRTVTRHLEQLQLSLAIEALQLFLWKDFADWYVEIHKVEKNTAVLRHVLRQLLVLLHPFAPFITEAIWSTLEERRLLMVEPWPLRKPLSASDRKALSEFQKFKRLVVGLRNFKIYGAGNEPATLQTRASLNETLVTRLSGILFGKVYGETFNIAGVSLTGESRDVKRYFAWLGTERGRLSGYIQELEQRLQSKIFKKKARSDVVQQMEQKYLEAKRRLDEEFPI